MRTPNLAVLSVRKITFTLPASMAFAMQPQASGLRYEDDDERLVKPQQQQQQSARRKNVIFSVLACFLVVSSCVALYTARGGMQGRRHQDQGHQGPNVKPGSAVGKTCPAAPFDYLMFVVRWAPSACRETKCVPEFDNKWVIHGLWPNYWNGKWPQFCCKTDPFDASKVKPLEDKLEVSASTIIFFLVTH